MDKIISLIGAGCFGSLIGWYVYYINRYRKGDVQLSDITTLIGVLGGGAATALFPSSGELFGAYGIGLFVGFFGYFIVLISLVYRSQNFDADWFLDGRRKAPVAPYSIPGEVAQPVRPMDVQFPPAEPVPLPSAKTQTATPLENVSQPPAAFPEWPIAPPSNVDLQQSAVDACVAVKFASAADINALFAADLGFIGWYNQNLANTPPFRHRGKIRATKLVADRFNGFWNQIPTIFEAPQITAIEFCALMSIGIQENSGDLWANPEKVGSAGHPGLAYAFDRIPGKKISYNHANGNWTAFTLFNDKDFLAAHSALEGSDRVLGNGVSNDWNGEIWPNEFSPAEDPRVNGFIMEADFYKFRGRGIIQTTGRDDYKPLIEFILDGAAAKNSAALVQLASGWRQKCQQGQQPGQLLDTVANVSTNAEWDSAFAEPTVLAAGVFIDSGAKGHYLRLDHDVGILSAGTGTRGSLYFMARKINGGSYPDQVVPMMKAMIAAIADLTNEMPSSRASRLVSDIELPAGLEAPPAEALAPTAMFTVHHGNHYQATVTLNWFEQQIATNATIAGQFSQLGFANVSVSGTGGTRLASGVWMGPDTTAQLDPHLSNITELA